MNVLILYASTSGSTRLLIQSLSAALCDTRVDAYEIKASHSPVQFENRDLIVLASPTYGTGDWHYSWDEKGADLLASLRPGARIGLLGLGDSRGHGRSFAGSIGKLAVLARTRNAQIVGAVPVENYSFESSPAIEDGMFPGLVVEYRRDRHTAEARVRQWLRGLLRSAVHERSTAILDRSAVSSL